MQGQAYSKAKKKAGFELESGIKWWWIQGRKDNAKHDYLGEEISTLTI